ncbi:unnamed protein product [Amoebophrya sp. A25]|nr:unnamed protein product [Amoebophrya sp. A25]|eukprot:GSA25T00017995001.1
MKQLKSISCGRTRKTCAVFEPSAASGGTKGSSNSSSSTVGRTSRHGGVGTFGSKKKLPPPTSVSLLLATTERGVSLHGIGSDFNSKLFVGKQLLGPEDFQISTGPAGNSAAAKTRSLMAQDACFVAQDGAIAAVSGGASVAIFRYDLYAPVDDVNIPQRVAKARFCGSAANRSQLANQLPAAGCIQQQQQQAITSAMSATKLTMITAPSSGVLSTAALTYSSGDKRLLLFDLAAEKVSLTGSPGGAHGGGKLTSMQFACPSASASFCGSDLDLFCTAGTDGFVDLYDIRTRGLMNPVESYSGRHKHSWHAIRARFSPCMRYICVGSEDGSIAMYDLRRVKERGLQRVGVRARDEADAGTTTVLSTTRHGAVSVCAAFDFHPVSGTLATGGHDQCVCLWKNSDLVLGSAGSGKLRMKKSMKGSNSSRRGGGMKVFEQEEQSDRILDVDSTVGAAVSDRRDEHEERMAHVNLERDELG